MGTPELEDVAGQLYELPPQDFTAARDEIVARARRNRDLELARAVKQLRKPTVGAWLADQLVHRDREQMEQFTTLGVRLREAQQALAGEQLRELLGQRRQLVAALVARARRYALEAGVRVGDAAEEELTETLHAALADEAAAAALLGGRLTRAVRPGQLPVASTKPGPAAAATATAKPQTKPTTPAPAQAKAEEKRRREAERQRERAAQAEQAAREAEQEATEAQHQVEVAEHGLAEAERHEREAHTQVEAAKAALDQAEAERTAAQEERGAAADAVGAARRRAQATARTARARRADADRLAL